mmetsp:Transcript_1786/g.2626  ORF Transcript_1786/g.2626 Transcript_1786/m.2626 type:complete len:447 (+) Transcript_1786:171-1511(+)
MKHRIVMTLPIGVISVVSLLLMHTMLNDGMLDDLIGIHQNNVNGEAHLEDMSREDVVISYRWKSHPFWNKGMAQFCDLVRRRLNETEKYENEQKSSHQDVSVELKISCRDPFKVFGLGTGNIVMAVYGLRLTAASLGVGFTFRCQEDEITTTSLGQMKNSFKNYTQMYTEDVLPWLQGEFQPPQKHNNPLSFSPYKPPIPSTSKTCRGFGRHPLHYMAGAMREDFRNMALKLVGSTTSERHNQDQYANDHPNKKIKPLVFNVTIDDVAIHFRCGDVLGIDTDTYGFIRFDSYRNNISPDASTIGIITQSFDGKENREQDRQFVIFCQELVGSLVTYIQGHFPKAIVSVRNVQETPALAYARLVLANQTFAGMSTFSIFPAIASFGTSYIQTTRLSYFVKPIEGVYSGVTMINGSILTSKQMRNLGSFEESIAWLKSDDDHTTRILS